MFIRLWSSNMMLDDAEIEVFLAQVDTDAPCGPNLEYDPQFLALERAASGRPARAMGEVAVAAVPPDWLEVRALASDLLRRSKDIRVAVFLGRAGISMDGIVGIRGTVDLVHRMLEQRWHCIHPQLEDIQGDPTARLNAIAGLADPDTTLSEVPYAMSYSRMLRINS
jgi:type VI secretion system protein ImpA